MPGAVELSQVQNAHLAVAGFQQRRAPVVVVGQHLQEALRPLEQPVVDMQRVSGAEAQVQLQHDGFGVLGVQQPGAAQLRGGAPVGPEEVGRGEGAVEVAQAFAAGGVGAAQLIGAVGAVAGSVAAQGGGEAACGLGLGAGNGTWGAEARRGLGGGRPAAALIGAVATLVLTVAPPRARETLSVAAQELVRLAAALTQVTYSG